MARRIVVTTGVITTAAVPQHKLKLSEAVIQWKVEGLSKVEALEKAKTAVKTIGKRWTTGVQEVFDTSWKKRVSTFKPKTARKSEKVSNLEPELKEALATHKKTLNKLRKVGLNIVREEEPYIGKDDYGKKCLLLGEIVVRGKTESYSINTPTLKSVAKWTKKSSWVFDVFKGKPDEVVNYVINALTKKGDIVKINSELKDKEKAILKLISDSASARITSTNVARLEYRSKTQGGKLLWIVVEAPREISDMAGIAIKEADAKKLKVTLQDVLDYLIVKDAKKPKREKRSKTYPIYD